MKTKYYKDVGYTEEDIYLKVINDKDWYFAIPKYDRTWDFIVFEEPRKHLQEISEEEMFLLLL